MQKSDDRVQIHKIKEHAHKMCLNESTVCLLVLIVTSEHAGFFHVVSRQHFHCRAPEPDRDAKKKHTSEGAKCKKGFAYYLCV